MAWISISKAVKEYRIGRDTLNKLVSDHVIEERQGMPAPNGIPCRLVNTEQLEEHGYVRRDGVDDEPMYLEQRVGGVEDATQAIIRQNHEILTLLRLLVEQIDAQPPDATEPEPLPNPHWVKRMLQRVLARLGVPASISTKRPVPLGLLSHSGRDLAL